ncbi:cell differentiation protein rcd1-like [Apium graveolens]|uniref:cell differentiation protein rcd1-like n=1 Tax=Apium graveolens TaxID=4045 RepID=UPI003D7A790F
MLNLPDSLYPDPIQGDNSVMSNGGAPANNNGPCDGASKAIDWPSASVEDLKQGRIQDLALHIWRSISTVFLLLSEVLSIYKSLTPEKLTMKDSSKVCDVLVLFECLATHPQTKMQFLNVQIHCYLYPFLETEETSKPFQYLRLMSLGVIGGLLKETASWIMSRIMMQEQGLQYCCEPANRLCAIMKVFNDVIEKMQDEPSTTVLKNIIQCYVILSDDPSRGCLLLRSFIPPILTTAPYIEALCARPITLKNLQDLFQKLSMGCGPNAEAVGDVAGSSHLDC